MVEIKKEGKSPGKLERWIDYFDGQKWDDGKKTKVANPNKTGQVMRGMTAGSILLGSCLTGGAAFPPLIVPVATGLALVAWWTSHTKWGQNKKRGLRARLKAPTGVDSKEMEEKKKQAEKEVMDASSDSTPNIELNQVREIELQNALEKLREYAPFLVEDGNNSFHYSPAFLQNDSYQKVLQSWSGHIWYKVGEQGAGVPLDTKKEPKKIAELLESEDFKKGKIRFFQDAECKKEEEIITPNLQNEIDNKLATIQKYMDIVKAYGIVPNEKFYANGRQQDKLKEAYDELDQWCRHDKDDDPKSLDDALKNSIRQGFEEKALANPKNASDFDAIEQGNEEFTQIKKWVACEEAEKDATEIPENSGRYYKPYIGTPPKDFWEKRLQEGSEKFLVTDENDPQKITEFTPAEQKFIEEKKKKLQPQWNILVAAGVTFKDIPDVRREKAVRLIQRYKEESNEGKKEEIKSAISDLKINDKAFEQLLSQRDNLTPEGVREYIPGDLIESSKNYHQAIKDKVLERDKSDLKNLTPAEQLYLTPAEQLYIQNGGKVSKWGLRKYLANITGSVTKTAAGIGSVYFLSCLIAAAPVIGTCGAAISLPFALAYGRNVYKSWQNTLNQGANRQARGLWTLKKLNFLSKPKGK